MDRRPSRFVVSVLSALVLLTTTAVPADAHRRRQSRRSPPAVAVAPTDENLGRLAMCESRINPTTNTGNGYYGAYQFSLRTWRSMPGRAGTWPHHFTYEEQRESARALVLRAGWRSQFPGCSRRLGFR